MKIDQSTEAIRSFGTARGVDGLSFNTFVTWRDDSGEIVAGRVFGVASGILIVKTGNGEIIYLRPPSLQCAIMKGD